MRLLIFVSVFLVLMTSCKKKQQATRENVDSSDTVSVTPDPLTPDPDPSVSPIDPETITGSTELPSSIPSESKYKEETAENNCSANFVETSQLSVDPFTPKFFTGDTVAAYGLFTYERTRTQRFVFKIKGKVPSARFVSFESYEGALQAKVDYAPDFQIFSQSSLTPPSDYANAEYEIYLKEADVPDIEGTANLDMPAPPLLIRQKGSMFYRVYVPTDLQDLTLEEDMPDVFAYDPDTGEPKACPEPYIDRAFSIPQSVLTIFRGIRHKTEYDFEPAPSWFNNLGLGGNSAIADYVVGTNKLFDDSVTVIKFKAPNSVSDSGVDPQVRYWSLCYQNFAKNETLACLADSIVRKDAEGNVVAVFGKTSAKTQEIVEGLGYNFVPDNRADNQATVGVAYRNLIPDQSFADTLMYKGDYLPKAMVCSEAEFENPETRLTKCGL